MHWQAWDTVNTDVSIPFLNVPKNIEMDILDDAFVNADVAEGEESDFGSHTVILEESFHSSTEDEVAQDAMGPHVDEDITPLTFPDDMPEIKRQKRQSEHNSGLPY